ncbi:MAG: heme biosynthesis protein HemY [Dermatophilaceae bacterium]
MMPEPANTPPDSGAHSAEAAHVPAARVHVELPRVRFEDMVTGQDADPPPDPTGGRDIEAEFFIRHVGW